jgi:3-oxoadipate enol-lactonase
MRHAVSSDVFALPGADLVYEVDGTGPAVVLVHGFGLDLRMWQPQVEPLTDDFQVVRYNCRGFGRAGAFDPSVPYTHAGDLLALLDHLAIADATLVGLSFGGRVALNTTLVSPTRVRGLALLDALLDGVPWDSGSVAGLEELTRQVAAGGVEAGRRAWMAHPLFAAARERPDLAAQLANMVADYPGQHWLGQDPEPPYDPQPIAVLETVAVPTLVVVGERDVPGFVEMADVLASRIRGAEYHRVPDAGHMVNMEAPEIVNALLAAFLSRIHSADHRSPD